MSDDAQQPASTDLVVVIPRREWSCARCGESGHFLRMENNEPLCLDCADLGHLIFLPSGDSALTRRARKASRLSAVVVQFSRSRRRYERQGILVEAAALDLAEEQCLADSELRERRRERSREYREREDSAFQAAFAAEIRRLFPGIPNDRADLIAGHSGRRGSGRVGRTAAGRTLDEEAITLAVVASVRHVDTDYDELLMNGTARADARERVAADVDRLLQRWRRRSSRLRG